jgi:hypothetical protein
MLRMFRLGPAREIKEPDPDMVITNIYRTIRSESEDLPISPKDDETSMSEDQGLSFLAVETLSNDQPNAICGVE